MNDSKEDNVILVFEPASDAHWMKDVVQFPNALAWELYKKNAVLITRPNQKQKEIAKHISLVSYGEPIRENEEAFEISNFSTIITEAKWYLQACKKAAALGSTLILYPWYGNPFKGAFYFKVRRWSKLKKATVIIKTDGLLQARSTYKASFKQRIKDKLRYSFIDKIIQENRQVDKALRINNPQLISKLIYIPNCPLDIYHNQKVIPYDERLSQVLFVGRVHEVQKGADILLEAWINIFKLLPGWILQIVGPCSAGYKNDWMEKLKEEKALDSVKWIDNTSPSGLIQHFNKSKIVVCPSRWDSGPIILSESILCGCSFIGTAVGEIPEVLKGLPGLVKGADTIEDQILFFAQHPEIAERQSKALFERMKNRKWSIYAKRLAEA